ncbi:hypothetical protein VNO78_25858 [Psophocarpus tetragonolobus]|uniref:Metallothionein-like protein n=1 Tax=Psophocarpus tetragonolobus TaxID=3891 RepID=A0AAN9S6N3_PSOTE
MVVRMDTVMEASRTMLEMQAKETTSRNWIVTRGRSRFQSLSSIAYFENVGCGSSCDCGSCGCNNYTCDFSYMEKTTTETLVLGVGPVKAQFEGVEMSVAAENGGCNCGSSCTCDPCSCK